MASPKAVIRWIGRNSKRVGITIAGVLLLLLGVAGLALPLLPGWLLLIAGFAVLATEYVWAERVLDATKKRAKQAAAKARGMGRKRAARRSARERDPAG